MKIKEVTNKSLTPQQARIKSLQDQAKRARDAVKAEKARQKILQGQKQLAGIR